jgi:hypothetical protein
MWDFLSRGGIVVDISALFGGEETFDAGSLDSKFDPFDLDSNGLSADCANDGIDA